MFNWIKTNWPLVLAGVGVLVLVFAFIVPGIISGIGGVINDYRIAKLEKEKVAAEEQVKKLQTQVDQKSGEITRLNDELTKSNERVQEASRNTGSARTVYTQVRNSKPTFIAPDDAGKVAELAAELRELYP